MPEIIFLDASNNKSKKIDLNAKKEDIQRAMNETFLNESKENKDNE